MAGPLGGSREAVADEPALVVEGIGKRFGATVALEGVGLSMRAGEVHALMGENGAGKSTLGKVIAGLHRQDSGSVRVGGRRLAAGSVEDAHRAGVRIVHQELAQCPSLSVAANLCLHRPPTSWGGLLDHAAARERAGELLAGLDPGIDVRAELGSLPPGRRQIVQIASALAGSHDSERPRVIIFDEPTSSLSVAEGERLLAIVRRLAGDGLTVVYVSHRMGEIFACCDRVTVLRDGRFVATSEVRAIDEASLVEQMIGRRIEVVAATERRVAELSPRLVVKGMRSPGKLHGIDLGVRPGEILGLGGLVGAGRSELLDAIFGLDARASGEVVVEGERLAGRSARAAIGAGVGYVPEDRKLQGLCFEMSLRENIVLPRVGRLARAGVRRMRRERGLFEERRSALAIKAPRESARPGTLSGGNQQKLLLGRWLSNDARVLLLDEPTRGIDVGTKAEIHRLIRRAAEGGAAIVLVSSEMPELLALADRILVLCEGRLAGELSGEGKRQAEILRLATLYHGGG